MSRARHPGNRGRQSIATAVVMASACVTALAPPAWAADPSGCTRDGTHIVCTQGVPKGQTLRGTAGDDVIEITGTVYGTVDGLAGNDAITVRGRDGARTDTTRGGDGDPAVDEGGWVLGGDGHDVIALTGGKGANGRNAHIRGSSVYDGGNGGQGGEAVDGGAVEGGRGVNIITLTGGDGGNGGDGRTISPTPPTGGRGLGRRGAAA
ncbi:hypothetical protein ACFQ2B_39840 [Streptomyces stramineus]